MVRTILFALAFNASALVAQQPALVGTWQISYPAELRVMNGVLDPVMATGTLTVEARGDSLIANLLTDASPDLRARPPLRLATKAGPNPTFESRSKATLNMNGEQTTVTSVNTWIFKATGDHLEGSVERKLEGMEDRNHGPQALKGTRKAR
jgi:hypothetical protein